MAVIGFECFRQPNYVWWCDNVRMFVWMREILFVFVCVCVCVRERVGGVEKLKLSAHMCVCESVCVIVVVCCVCVCVMERVGCVEKLKLSVHMCVCVSV